MCSCVFCSVGFVFLACARVGLRACVWFLGVVRVPRVWLFGCRESGEGTCRLVLSPLFLLFVWSGRRDLNPLPPPWEGGALAW